MVLASFCSADQNTMATMNEEMVNVDTKKDIEDGTNSEKISSGDVEDESQNRVQRFDMV